MSTNAISNLNAVAPGLVPALAVVRPPPPQTAASGSNASLAPLTAEAGLESPGSPASAAELDQAVTELNHYVAGSRTDLQFRVDEEVGRLVVSIVDSQSGQVLRQMPSEDALRIARYLENGEVHLLHKQA